MGAVAKARHDAKVRKVLKVIAGGAPALKPGQDVDDAVVVRLIHEGYSKFAKLLTEYRHKKRAVGRCGGEFNCMRKVPIGARPGSCQRCRDRAEQRRLNPNKKPVTVSEYAKQWKRLLEEAS